MLVYLVDLCLYCCVRGMGLWCAQSAQVVHKQKPALYTLQAFGDLSTTAFQAESNTSCNLIVSKDYGTWFSSWRKVFSSSGKRSNLDLSQHLSLHCKRVGLPSGKSKVSFSSSPSNLVHLWESEDPKRIWPMQSILWPSAGESCHADARIVNYSEGLLQTM